MLYEKSIVIEYDKLSILNALEEERTAKISNSDGKTATGYLQCLRQDGDVKWFFLAHHKYSRDNVDSATAEKLIITFNGEYTPKLYNTVEGTVEDIDFETKDGKTYIYKTVYSFDSLLIQLTEGKGSYFSVEYAKNKKEDSKDVQPWVIEEEKAEHFVTLKFDIESTAEFENVFIAGEDAEYIKLNSKHPAVIM